MKLTLFMPKNLSLPSSLKGLVSAKICSSGESTTLLALLLVGEVVDRLAGPW